MRTTSRPVAILISDLHLSHRAPVARAENEGEDWYRVQASYLQRLKKIALTGRENELPIIAAGDIFDKWNSPAELINFAIQEMPVVYAVPGQHDLPHHRYEDIKRSAYWTLVEAGKIINLKPGVCTRISERHGVSAQGFPWGTEVTRPERFSGGGDWVHIAVVHAYCWLSGHCHPGASAEAHAADWYRKVKDYTVAVFGDNHQPFQHKNIFNHGTFIRRRSDDITLSPAPGIVYSDGTVARAEWDTEADRFVGKSDFAVKAEESGVDIDAISELLLDLGDRIVSFRETAIRTLQEKKHTELLRKTVLAWLEETSGN